MYTLIIVAILHLAVMQYCLQSQLKYRLVSLSLLFCTTTVLAYQVIDMIEPGNTLLMLAAALAGASGNIIGVQSLVARIKGRSEK